MSAGKAENAERPTSNAERPTSNVERRKPDWSLTLEYLRAIDGWYATKLGSAEDDAAWILLNAARAAFYAGMSSVEPRTSNPGPITKQMWSVVIWNGFLWLATDIFGPTRENVEKLFQSAGNATVKPVQITVTYHMEAK